MFIVIFTKKVVFKDHDGNIIRVFEIGDRIPFTGKTEIYFITSIGGIFFDEAQEI